MDVAANRVCPDDRFARADQAGKASTALREEIGCFNLEYTPEGPDELIGAGTNRGSASKPLSEVLNLHPRAREPNMQDARFGRPRYRAPWPRCEDRGQGRSDKV